MIIILHCVLYILWVITKVTVWNHRPQLESFSFRLSDLWLGQPVQLTSDVPSSHMVSSSGRSALDMMAVLDNLPRHSTTWKLWPMFVCGWRYATLVCNIMDEVTRTGYCDIPIQHISLLRIVSAALHPATRYGAPDTPYQSTDLPKNQGHRYQ